jgi:hypothetical protein
MALGQSITDTDVRNALSESTYDLFTLCISTLINKWSKYKPVRGDRDYDFGFDTLTGTLNALPANAWGYLKPRGGSWGGSPDEPGRLDDFRGYNHSAIAPASGESYQSADTYSVAMFFPPTTFTSVDDFLMSDFIDVDWDNWYFGVRLKSADSDYIYSVSDTDIKPGSGYLGRGVYFYFSKSKMSGFNATGTYTYECFITPNYESALDLILNSELSGTQEDYPLIMLPNGYGSFERVSVPASPTLPAFYSGTCPADISVTGTVTLNEDHVHYTVTNNTGSSKDITATLTVTQGGITLYDEVTDSYTIGTGANASQMFIWKRYPASYNQQFTVKIAYS